MTTITGRIQEAPSLMWHEEVLAPQFAYEVEHLLPHYVAIEQVLLLEYLRMGLVDADGAAALGARLGTLSAQELAADPEQNMSDICFAIERHVAAGPAAPFPAWHADRSRNDQQACAQLMAAREQVRTLAEDLTGFGRATAALAGASAELPMPGYTHAQAAQIITPGFYLAALSAETLGAARRLLAAYDEIDACPLGSGTMAGQELPWDRDRMAALLGFARPNPHALVGVASRGWALSVAMELSNFAITLSRFVTDLMTWGGSAYGFLELPDALSGISAAMPQKRNYPVLERIRGRCAHVVGSAFDLAHGQRNTAYANTVEVSKEAGGRLLTQTDALRSTLRMARAVVDNLHWRADRMRQACEGEYLGGFTLANRLALDHGVPWRTAQVIVGRYVREMSAAKADGEGSASTESPGAESAGAGLLSAIAAEAGHDLPDAASLLASAFDVDSGLRAKQSAGSTHPDAVRAVLADQEAGYAEVEDRWRSRRQAAATARDTVRALLTGAGSTP